MNPSNPSLPDNTDDACDLDVQRCLMYLFGELDLEESQQFEQVLEQDAELRARFVTQAQMIASLGGAAMSTASLANAVTPVNQVAAGKTSGRTRAVKVGGWIAALAASFLCLLWWGQGHDQPTNMAAEDRLQTQRLADAWLDSFGTVSETSQLATLDDIDLQLDSEDLIEAWQEPAAPPEWMIAALAGLDAENSNGAEVSGG